MVPAVTLAEFDAARSARETDHAAAAAYTTPAARDSDVARADTLVAEERTAPAPSKSRRGLLWIAGLALVTAAGFAALRVASPSRATTASSAERAIPSAAPTPSVAPERSGPVVTPAPSLAPSATVRVEVKTVPAGAVIKKDGYQVCDSTPCELFAAPNEGFTLDATKGALKGSTKVLAQRDQSVEIKLIAPVAAPAKTEKVWCYREVQNGDIKSLEKFRCPQ
jgi:hypothetical protein